MIAVPYSVLGSIIAMALAVLSTIAPDRPSHRTSGTPVAPAGTLLIQLTHTSFQGQPFGKRDHVTGQPPPAFTSFTIDEFEHGSEQASFSTDSEQHPGFQQLSTDTSVQIYDPADNTIYETTPAAYQSAFRRQAERALPKGGGGKAFFFSAGSDDVAPGPGHLSSYEQRLNRHLYRRAGMTTVDGRHVLKLAPVRASIKVQGSGNGGARELLGTVYVSPATFYPVRQVFSDSNTTIDWDEYKIVSLTAADGRLLSLTDRHPHSRVVHGADAYLRISEAANRR